MLRLAAVLTFAMASAAVPATALAADPANIGCVEAGIDARTRAELLIDVERNLQDTKNQSYRPVVVDGVRAAARVCQGKHGWSDAAASAAILYAVPRVSWPLAVRMAKAKGVDAALLEKRLMALPDAERATATTREVLQKLASGSIAAGEIDGTNAALAGGVYGLLALREKALADFKAN
jgi:hypothetical protein